VQAEQRGYDFRKNVPGDTLTITVGKERHTIAKIMSGSVLDGWVLNGEALVRLVVLDPPFSTSSAEMRSSHTLGIEKLENPNRIHSLGEDPVVTMPLALTSR